MNKLLSAVIASVFMYPAVASAHLDGHSNGVVVTANRHAMQGHKVPSNVTVITQEQIASSNAQTVPDLLEQVEGVFIYNNSTAKTSSVDIRGFGDTAGRNVLVLVDGRKINTPDSGTADLVQVPVEAIDRIEILRGGGSVLYGDNAVGGVINIITKKGNGPITGKLGYFGGSYGTSGAQMQVSGSEKGLSYSFNAKYFDKGGYRNNADELYKNYNARLDYDLNDRFAIGIQYGFHEDQYDLPGGLNATELETLGRRGSADEGNVADTEDEYIQLTFDIDPIPGSTDWGYFQVDASLREREVFDNIRFGTSNFSSNRSTDTEGVALKYIFDREVFDREVDFILGADKYRHETMIIGSGVNTDNLIISKDEYGFFGNLEVEVVPNLFFIGGSRFHKAEFTFDQRSGTPNFEKQKPDESVSSAGVKYEYGTGSNVFANFKQSFRFLTPNEWYSSFSGLNTDLEQQRGKQYEIGIKHNFNNHAVVSVTPYWLETENEIFFDPANGFFGSNSNYDEIRRIGVEVGTRFDLKGVMGEVEFVDKFEYFANYTYQNPEFTDGINDGKKVPLVPTHQFNTGIVMRLKKHFNISLTSRYVGSRFAINDTPNTLAKAKSYFVTDLKVSYIRKYFEIFVSINNLFDRKYNTYEATNSSQSVRDVYPAAERNYLGGVSVKF